MALGVQVEQRGEVLAGGPPDRRSVRDGTRRTLPADPRGGAAQLLETSPRVHNRWEPDRPYRAWILVQVADLLKVSLDELVGREDFEEHELRLRNPKLHELYREIDRLSDEDQKALGILLDSLVKRSQIGRVLAG